MKSFTSPLLFVLAFMLIALWSCDPSQKGNDPFTRLADALTGEFETSLPSGTETTLAIDRVWEDNHDGYWLLAHEGEGEEKATALEAWVFHLKQMKSTYVLDIYAFNDDETAKDMQKHPEHITKLGPEDLFLINGCEIYLTESSGSFSGSTLNKTCDFGAGGVAYLSLEMDISKKEIAFIRKAFDDDGVMVSGPADDKPQVYTKTANHPLHADHGDGHGGGHH